MMARRGLAVWLDGVEVAALHEARSGKLVLEYSDAAVRRWPAGRPVLSVALPMRPDRRHAPAAVTPYFEGLLPEGQARNVLEDEFGVRRGDTFGLLAAIGRDCAGAVVISPSHDDGPATRHAISGQPLSEDELRNALDGLEAHPLGASPNVRVSLAGQQDKLLLARDDEGRWLRPTGQSPSTHILKPEDARFPGSVANEALCLNVARELGLSNVAAEVLDVGGPVLAVARYDRARHGDGTVSRVHQEDSCQALSVPVDFRGEAKYQAGGGPSFKQVAEVLDRFAIDPITELENLLAAMVFTVVIGNADAHGKNVSFLHDPIGAIRLAPLYDVMCTIWYADVVTARGSVPVSTELAMTIGQAVDISSVTVEDLVTEAVSWKVNNNRAQRVVAMTLERLNEAVDRAAETTDGADSGIVSLIHHRLRNLMSHRRAGGEAVR